MLEALKKEVCQANLDLVKTGLVLLTWGNVSAFDKKSGFMVIKPSGVSYDNMNPKDMVVVDMEGNVIEGDYRPSSDTATHIEIYKAFGVGGIVHTHSKWGTIWSQAGVEIPYLGTTHADNFYGNIPCTRALTDEEINGAYEKETGNVIVKTFKDKNIDPNNIPGVVITNHAPFTWGKTAAKAVENAVVLEYVAEMAYYTLDLNDKATMRQTILDKHFLRKHGANAYYGQKEK